MKYILFVLLTAIPLLSAELNWLHSYDKAIQEATKTGKNIIVFIEADNCPYCERMKDDVWEVQDVINSLDGFIPLQLDISSKDVKKHFPKASVTPTTYFITPDNRLLEEIVGYINEEFFYWRLSSAEREIKLIQKEKK